MKIFRSYFGFIILFIAGIIPLLDLFHPGLPLTHDGQDHVARIANFYISLTQGNLVPRWAGNLNWGYGHPILMFLYPLPSYLASFFHVLGFSLVDSLKIVFGITFIFSGFTMYFWMRNVMGERAGIVAGVLYMYAPYRFVDLYVRGDIGEHVAFLFAPLILHFMLKASKEKDKLVSFYSLLLSLSVCGLLLAHNALAILFLFICLLYGLMLIYFSKNKLRLFLQYLFFGLLGVGMSSFFIVPAFFEGKYTLRDIVTGGGIYKSSFVNFFDLFNPGWSYGGSAFLSKQIGVAQILAIIFSFFALKHIKKQKLLPQYILFLGIFLFTLFLMLPASNFLWEKITILQKFQFPWRMLAVVVLTSAALSSFSALLFKNKKRTSTLYFWLLISLPIMLYYPYYHAHGFLYKPESFYTGVYNGTTDTGESSPIWSTRFMEYSASKSAEFILGDGTIDNVSRTFNKHTYSITVTSSTARIRENTLYFPNWQVLDGEIALPIQFQDKNNRGLITYTLPQGTHFITVVFKDTKLRVLANIATIVSSVIAFGIFVYLIFRLRKLKT